MKNCKECNEFMCGSSGTDNVSEYCGKPAETPCMNHFDTGAVREDKTGKGRCDLLPTSALIRLSKHFEAGTVAHGERNWERAYRCTAFWILHSGIFTNTLMGRLTKTTSVLQRGTYCARCGRRRSTRRCRIYPRASRTNERPQQTA